MIRMLSMEISFHIPCHQDHRFSDEIMERSKILIQWFKWWDTTSIPQILCLHVTACHHILAKIQSLPGQILIQLQEAIHLMHLVTHLLNFLLVIYCWLAIYHLRSPWSWSYGYEAYKLWAFKDFGVYCYLWTYIWRWRRHTICVESSWFWQHNQPLWTSR